MAAVLGLARWILREIIFDMKLRLNGKSSLWANGFELHQTDGKKVITKAQKTAMKLIKNAKTLKKDQDFTVLEDGEGSVRIFFKPGKNGYDFTDLVNSVPRTEIAKYLGGEPIIESFMVQLSVPFSEKAESRFGRLGYHIDSHVRRIKTYVYLTDVDLHNGPLFIVQGTNKLSLYKISKFWQLLKLGGLDKSPHHYYVTPSNPKYEELESASQPLTGSAGTMVTFDTRTYHKAGKLTKGKRLVFDVTWIRPENYVSKRDWETPKY